MRLHPQKFRKKPVVIEAMRWLGLAARPGSGWVPPIGGATITDLQEWGARVEPTEFWSQDGHPEQFTLRVYAAPEDTWVKCPAGFWIIRGVNGEFYPCDPDVFQKTYEPYTPAVV